MLRVLAFTTRGRSVQPFQARGLATQAGKVPYSVAQVYNLALGAYLDLSQKRAAFHLHEEMRKKGIIPELSYLSRLTNRHLCAAHNKLRQASSLTLVNGAYHCIPEDPCTNLNKKEDKLVTEISDQLTFRQLFRKKNWKLIISRYEQDPSPKDALDNHCILLSYAQLKQFNKVDQMFASIKERNQAPILEYRTMAQIYCMISTSRVEALVMEMKEQNLDLDHDMYITLITMYGKFKRLDKLHELRDETRAVGVGLDIDFVTTLITALGSNGDIETCLEILEEAEECGLSLPSEVFFLRILNNQGWFETVIERFEKKIANPCPVTYQAVLYAHAKLGHYQQVIDIYDGLTNPTTKTHTIALFVAKAMPLSTDLQHRIHDIYSLMKTSKLIPHFGLYSSLVENSESLDAVLEKTSQLCEEMAVNGMSPTIEFLTSKLETFYFHTPDLNTALVVQSEIEASGLKPLEDTNRTLFFVNRNAFNYSKAIKNYQALVKEGHHIPAQMYQNLLVFPDQDLKDQGVDRLTLYREIEKRRQATKHLYRFLTVNQNMFYQEGVAEIIRTMEAEMPQIITKSRNVAE